MRGIGGATAIVTGAASGIGAATARRLAQEGARVVCVDLDGDGVAAVAAQLPGEGLAVTADVSREADVERYMEVALERFGSVELVFLNAGGGGPFCSFFEVTTEQFEERGGGHRRGPLARPLERFGQPEEVAGLVAHLLSDDPRTSPAPRFPSSATRWRPTPARRAALSAAALSARAGASARSRSCRARGCRRGRARP